MFGEHWMINNNLKYKQVITPPPTPPAISHLNFTKNCFYYNLFVFATRLVLCKINKKGSHTNQLRHECVIINTIQLYKNRGLRVRMMIYLTALFKTTLREPIPPNRNLCTEFRLNSLVGFWGVVMSESAIVFI